MRTSVLTGWRLGLLGVLAGVVMPCVMANASDERPGESAGPTEITVNTYILDIPAIDNVDQEFTIDVFVAFSWNDPRLAVPDGEAVGRIRSMSADDIWTPRLTAANNRGLERRLPNRVDVDDAGNVVMQQRYFGKLAVDMELGEFPFDTQVLPIELLSYGPDANDLSFKYVEVDPGRDLDFSAEGWVFERLAADTSPLQIGLTKKHYPRLTVRLQAKRQPAYYLLTMMFPMSLILFMAWLVFWLPPSIVPSRVAVSTASIFSLIALGFSIRLGLPQVAYLTRADIFVLGSTLLVFLGLGIVIAGSRMALRDREAAADALNAAMRWVYPVLYCLIVLVAGFG